MRNVKQIYRAISQHWVGDGFLVQPLFSHMGDDRGTNPFLMLDYAAPYEFPPTKPAARAVSANTRTKALKPLPSPTTAKWHTATPAAEAASFTKATCNG